MASTPTPRSYQTIISDMIATFTSRYGIQSLQVGGPILSFLEACSQSDTRNAQDQFAALAARNIDYAEKQQLDLIGQEEGIPRIQESPGTGYVTVSDSSFAKQSSSLFPGSTPPILGTTTIVVTDASAFYTHGGSNTGSLYIGRGTSNYEGPLSYTAIAPNVWPNPSYYSITLSTPTSKYHNLSEIVVIANGGNRLISAGTVIQTARSATVDAIQTSVRFGVELLDGEDTVSNVPVVCNKPGKNIIPKGALNSFVSSPFTGATVTNSSVISNGTNTESDEAYRERIKATRASRAKATPLAIKTAALGVTASDEDKQVASASLVEGDNSTLYIDDGNGYEETRVGVAVECLEASATGGEKYFQLRRKPVARACLTSTALAPFDFSGFADDADSRGYLCLLALRNNTTGVTSEHRFGISDFANLASVQAHEVVASINADAAFGFQAKTTGAGQAVLVEAIAGEAEDLEVVSASDSGHDANDVLRLPTGLVSNVRLYKNDVLIYEDGRAAVAVSMLPSAWNTMSGSQTITLSVDGTASTTYTITDAHFAANTIYPALSNLAPVPAWVTVINAVIPGITAREAGGRISLTSNLGQSARAAVAITGGTLVSSNVFAVQTATGLQNDYTLDRSRGQITLAEPLLAGDSLYAGSLYTNGFIESESFTSKTLASTAQMWVIADAPVTAISHNLSAGSVVNLVNAPVGFGMPRAISLGGVSGSFTNVRAGDWMVVWDSALVAAGFVGAWKVVDAVHLGGGDLVYVETGDTVPASASGISLNSGGVAFARTIGTVTELSLPAGTYSPSDVASAISTTAPSIDSYVTNKNTVRIVSKASGAEGSVALVGQNAQAALLGFDISDSVHGTDSHQAYVRSASCVGEPVTVKKTTAFTANKDELIYGGSLSSVGNLVRGTTITNPLAPRRQNNERFHSPIVSDSGGTITTRKDAVQPWSAVDYFVEHSPLALGPEDTLSVGLDGDSTGKRFNVNLFRRMSPASANYTSSPVFKDADNVVLGVPQSLAQVFGNGFDYNDWALYMHARNKTSVTNLDADTNKTVLWRYKRMGLEGEGVRVRYDYPRRPLQPVSTFTDIHSSPVYGRTSIRLASGAGRTLGLRAAMRVGSCRVKVGADVSKTYLVFGLSTTSGARSGNVVTLTLSLPAGITDHGLQLWSNIFVTSPDANYPGGNYKLTGRTPTTISYQDSDPGGAAPPADPALVGTIHITSDDSPATGRDFTLTGAGVQVNDIVSMYEPFVPLVSSSGSDTALPDYGVGRVQTLSDRYCVVYSDNGTTMPSDVTVLSWYPLLSELPFEFYPLLTASNRPEAIVAAVNAIDTSPVTATLIGAGGVGNEITRAHWDEDGLYTGSAPDIGNADTLTDGLAFVASTTQTGGAGSDYELTLKAAIANPRLLATADWTHEEVRAVPVTAERLSAYLNLPTISGIPSNATVTLCDDGKKIQLQTATVGSSGSVSVLGGTGNSQTATVVGAAIRNSSNIVVPINTSDAVGLRGGHWVRIANGQPAAKLGPYLTSATVLNSIENRPEGVVRLTLAPATSFGACRDHVVDGYANVTASGKLVSMAVTEVISSISEGDWIFVQPSSSETSNLSDANRGWFKVIGVVNLAPNLNVITFENERAIEENGYLNLAILTNNSLIPGDKLVISCNAWGSEMRGSWTVASVGGDDSTAPDTWTFGGGTYGIVDLVADRAVTDTSTPKASLGANLPFFRVYEGRASNWVKQIVTIVPTNSDPTKTNLVLSDATNYAIGYEQISPVYGSVVQAMDKLGFSANVANGLDGYRYHSGLIGEVNQVIYGNPSDLASYPGVAAANAKISVRGPTVKRITVSVNVRIKSRRSSDVADRIRTAIAAQVNQTGVGQAIAISDLIKAASDVVGVQAVSVISPTYSSSSDLIPVQPHEKPMVLDLSKDITVSFT